MPNPPSILLALTALSASLASADVIINEISATQAERLLRWDSNDQPHAGSGPPWWSPEFDDSTWLSGPTPVGFDLGTIATDLSSTVKGVTPSFYARKTFSASAAVAGSGVSLTLTINCNDGFIVWLNGKELARCNMGEDKAHIYADQLAYRDAGGSTATTNLNLGPASASLMEGDNTLAVQVNNFDIDSSLRLEMALSVGPTALFPLGSTVNYFPGLIEPTSDLSEPAALTAGTSDWIELHNDGIDPVDLSDWSLTDEAGDPDKWRFPAGTSIPAGGYLVVLADNPDVPITGAEYLHAGFKLSGSGEYLGLFDDSGTLQSEIAPEYPRQYDFYSFGTAPGGGSLSYLGLPTPGAENTGPAFTGKVDAPDFDIEGGFFDSSVTITLTTETAGASIRYTTDGTEPTPTTGTGYNGPIPLAMISNKKGHVIRARAFLSGMIDSNTKTNTYLIGQDPRLRTAPALVYSADLPRSLYDPFGVLAIDGGTYPNNSWLAGEKDDYNNVVNRGRAYERPIHAEFYFADGTAGFRTDCGVRIAASSFSRPRMTLSTLSSSPWPAEPLNKPSFNLYFRNEYGNPDVTMPFNGENAIVNNFEQLRARAGKNDIRNPFIIDELFRRLSRDMGQVASTGVINSLYINGEFKGYYNLVERLRTPFMRAHHGSDAGADWDVLQFENNDNIATGDKVAWEELLTRLDAAETVPNWDAVLEYVDPINVADYFILNIYASMWDWPHNNWVLARERSTEGRYRAYVWDAEGAIDNRGDRDESTNMIDNHIIGLTPGVGGRAGQEGELRDLWRGLNRWEEFRILFADRINKHLFNGGVLDDRDFDNSHISFLNQQLVEEFDDLLSFVRNETVNTSHTRNWATTSGSSLPRRNYLFGPNRESFRDHDLWPTVTPTEFNQFGGSVPAGFPLVFSNESGDIVYTTDGTDPRLPGGAPNPAATSQGGSALDIDLIDAGSQWKFHDLGEDLGTAWREVGFNDGTWAQGAAPLGYGNIGNPPITLTPMNNPADRFPTCYMRSTFEVADAPAYSELRLSMKVDGGAVIYLNGEEAARPFMPEGEIDYNTVTQTDGDENNFLDYTLDPSLLVTGTNTIAVEVHNRPSSSDMVLDLALDGTRSNPDNPPYLITTPVTVMARSFDGTTWSALTSADFTVDTTPAVTANLAITEMLYNPAGPSAAEQLAGFDDGDQFEFLQIKNIGPQAIDLHGVRFTDGISFDFGTGDVRALAPGNHALIVSNPAAFRERYGDGFDPIIAGQYGGRLNNGGEHMRLIDAQGDTLHDFTYAIASPWPDLGALDGHSIQIIDPSSSHDEGSNWTASASPGGNPGAGSLSFSDWQTANFSSNPALAGADLDPDSDLLDNFTEFALGTPPLSPDNGVPLPTASLLPDGTLILEYTRHPGERQVTFGLQSSNDLSSWADSATPEGSPTTEPDGTITARLRDSAPAGSEARRYVRLKMSSP